MPEVASQTLDFVGRELNVTLTDARTALENYVEQPDNISLLERCTLELHQVQGVLRVLEIYGAALLAEEMEQVASYLLQTATERKSQAESLDALMRAMVQLPSYLERVLAGGRDLALVLLPLLNDLRAVRGSALLSEGTLLLLNLKSDKQAQPVAAAPGEPPLTVEQWGRRLRARFQVGLIGWIRGERIEQNLDILAAVAQKLEQIATRQPVFQLWWVTGAVIEALQENGLEGGVSIKRLLGLGDREIRRLYEQGEARYAQSPAVELLNNLLYYVGRAESSGPRVMAVRASFRLQELLPVDESVEQERENLSAPSVKLMQTVAVAIREDLSKVKDVLDIFVRRGAGQPKELLSQVEMLRKIGDTLGVLGLGELRGNVQAETERLQKIVDGTLPADEATLVQIAASLINVEDRLDSQLVGLIRPKSATAPEENEDNEFQQVQSAVLRECILNLARIKEAVVQNVGGTLDAAGLDSWQDLMRGLKAGLLMLGKARAVEVIEGVTGQLKRVMQPGGQALPSGFMDRLADAIVSIEYYMETLQAGRSDPWYMLDNAQACVQALEHLQTPIIPTIPPVDSDAYAKTVAISPAAVFGTDDQSATVVGAATTPLTPTPRAAPPVVVPTADPELVSLFIEEAQEELAKIKKFFPVWDTNPMEREALVTVRRSFHTLKGSGRMVGARELGEFAWSLENLLNRVLDNTLTRSPAIVEVLRDGVAALPELIEQLETGRAPRADAAFIAARAQALAAGKPVPAPGTPVPPLGTNTITAGAPAAAPASTATPPPTSAFQSPGYTEVLPPGAGDRTQVIAPPFPDRTQVISSPFPDHTQVIPPPTGYDSTHVGTLAADAPAANEAAGQAIDFLTPEPEGEAAAAGGSATAASDSDSATDENPVVKGFSAFSGQQSGTGHTEGLAGLADAREHGAAQDSDAAQSLDSLDADHPDLDLSGMESEAAADGHAEPAADEVAAAASSLDMLLPDEPGTEHHEVLDPEGLGPVETFTESAGSDTDAAHAAAAATSAHTEAAAEAAQGADGAGAGEAAASGEPHAATGLDTFGGIDPFADEGDAPPLQAQDDVLREIYTRETSTHVATVRAYLERESGRPEPHPIPEDVYRACHTLSGSSKMAQARHGIRLAEPLDHWLRRVNSSGLGLVNPDMSLLADCMGAMESVVSKLDESTGYFQNHVLLQQRIAEAEKRLDERIAAAAAAEKQADVAPVGAEDELMEESADFDPEVAAIFTEEAMELIEASEGALADWRSEPESAEYRSALKRPLHTLKGGARMAGITAMGDLSHELETLVNQADTGLLAADDNMFDVIQSSLDELARMREAVANGGRVSSARAMIARIHALTRPKSAGAAAEPPASRPTSVIFESERTQSPAVPPPAAPVMADVPAFARAAEPAAPVEESAPAEAALPPHDFEPVSEPGAGDLAAELAAGYPGAEPADAGHDEAVAHADDHAERAPADHAAIDQFATDHERAEHAAADHELSEHAEQLAADQAPPGELISADGAGEFAIEGGAASGDEVAADYLEAQGAAANEEVSNVQSWTPESTQQHPVLDQTAADGAANDSSEPAREEHEAAHEFTFGPEDQPPAMGEDTSADELTGEAAIDSAAAEAAPHTHTMPAGSPPAANDYSAEPSVSETASPDEEPKSVSVSIGGRDNRGGEDGLVAPQLVPPGRETAAPAERQEMARVDAELLDQLLNISGEASIARSRLEQQMGSIDFNLGELSRTVTRLKEQLRNLEIETEAQILHRHEDESSHRGDFDPLELDRYSSIQQFSRALAETANDVGSIQQLLENLGKETQNLLQQQARTITELQNGLMRTRMVPFQRHVQRLARIVRQAANESGKKAELVVEGASGELDRQVLERMLPPFEHMLRNAVVHGIEKPADRVAAGKPEAGKIVLELHREGAEVMVRLTDDGGGMNLQAIRDKGASLGLISPSQVISDEDAMQLILEPGFSTAGTITQQAGRGVGMDVVATEIKRLGGALHMETKPGHGTIFTIRLPFTLAISHALVVRTGDEYYALPLPTVEGVLRLSKQEVLNHLGKDAAAFEYGGQNYRFQHLATFVSLESSPLPEQDVTIPVVLVRAGEHSTGLIADELVGSREIVVKSVGPQISSIRGISGATILGDGRIVIILDIGALVRSEWRGKTQVPVALKDKSDKRTFAMVVDDSITVRRVTQRLLERNGMRVLTARDGMDAVTLLQDNVPDIILLDIEMPRMDGYEVAAHVRNDPRLKNVPIIMITSRVGEKHRARAIELGVNDYLGKPYQETQLLDAISPLVERRRDAQGSGTYDG